jgi:hypothetical protein
VKPSGPKSRNEALDLDRMFNDAAIGLNLIYDAAATGHEGAKEILRAESERLFTRGAQWCDLQHLKK